MDTLKAVLIDLWNFLLIEFSGRASIVRETALLPASVQRAISIQSPRPLATPVSTPITLSSPASTNPSQLTVAVSEAALFNSPVAAFDGVITLLPFGQTVTYHQRQNRWLLVDTGSVKGWILADNVSEEHVMPHFVSSVYFDAKHEVTKKVRAFIQNEFFGEELLAPLQNVEYVSYRLRRKNKKIPWGLERPRTPGTWQRLLRGKSGVHIGISPRTDSVMEIINEDETGRLAYVDAVFSNQSILVSEVGYPEEGYFAGQTLERDTWRELQPIFIDIT